MKRGIGLLLIVVLVSIFSVGCSNPVQSISGNAVNEDSRAIESVVPWEAWKSYSIGQKVSHKGYNYSCIQAHTSQPDWEPQVVPALWKNLGQSGGTPGGLKLIPTWKADIDLEAGDTVFYEEEYYMAPIAHRTQAHFNPASTPTLYTPVEMPANAHDLTMFESSSNHRIDGNIIKPRPSGPGGYLVRNSYLFKKNQSIPIKSGQTYWLQFDIEALDVKPEIIKDSMRLKIYFDEKPQDRDYFSAIVGPYANAVYENGKATVTMMVDNIPRSGTIRATTVENHSRFYDFGSTDMKITNISYAISGQENSNTLGIPYPTRKALGHAFASSPFLLNKDIDVLEMESRTYELFKSWKDKYLLDASKYNAPGKYIAYGGGVEKIPSEGSNKMVPITTSESHGYGMKILALMATPEYDTKADFDAMVDYYLHFQTTEGTNAPIMAWQQSMALEDMTINPIAYNNAGAPTKGEAITIKAKEIMITPTQFKDDGDHVWGGAGGAADGDMDIVYALLLADKQWGSGTGNKNYKQLADNLLSKIEEAYVSLPAADGSMHILTATYLNLYTNGTTPGADNAKYWRTRLSDYLPANFDAFARFRFDNGDEDKAYWWGKVNKFMRHRVIDATQNGITSDFIHSTDGGVSWTPIPKGDTVVEPNAGAYYWNTCRLPFRLAARANCDYGPPNYFIPMLKGFSEFFDSKTPNNNMDVFECGYWPEDGSEVNSYQCAGKNLSFTAPALAATIGRDNYYFGDDPDRIMALYNHVMDDSNIRADVTNIDPFNQPYVGYYDETIRLISLLIATGNYYNLDKITYR